MRFSAGTSCSIAITLAPGEFLDNGIAFHVVAVSVTAENDFDVSEFEAELSNAVADLRDGRFVVGVDQNVTLGGGDEIATQVRSADEVNIADNLVGRERSVSINRLRHK